MCGFDEARASGMYYKHITIIMDTASIISK